jgi:hypothetical protein
MAEKVFISSISKIRSRYVKFVRQIYKQPFLSQTVHRRRYSHMATHTCGGYERGQVAYAWTA